ncbi:flagellar basal body-associated FliL family protein [Candidatus Accumulibacter vicinus]|uniref:Flagellar protein FliL n=1 Tax=Candidatus Accumulibacter vicinus TaxID=2954382 RepID=A0A084XWW6_9PROT|nr:flagellar basal body-associated FliL family protein [Candidatus Accumulibacter vicinus]KFB66960.1 MAG: flagellar basal body-associated protein FliL [Candidatus Accumulibacter vicinus]
MAKDAKPVTEGVDAPPAKNNKKLFIIIAILVLVLGIGGVTAFLMLRHSPEQGDDDGEVAVEKVKPVKKKKVDKNAPPVYIPLDAFTVNLVPERGDQFLQLVLSVEVDDPQTGEQLKVYMPKLRNDLTLLLSSKKASDLISTEGKEKLAREIMEKMNGVLDPAGKGKSRDGPIREVLFTSFIIQ